ncbi:HNH endonuclease signature motif containing protein [Nocardioides ochotonae]|uniref:HNH endonuclease signature motif containing protein n=1 Tax=Nocardioides ochotonae TaxID=2685869 RepID=UPI0014076AB0
MPLDLGRTNRLFSPGQRKALAIRDKECRADGCTIPSTWCEADHVDPWSAGGKTDLDNAILLCGHHHHLIHDGRCLHQRMSNGDLRFTRRTSRPRDPPYRSSHAPHSASESRHSSSAWSAATAWGAGVSSAQSER